MAMPNITLFTGILPSEDDPATFPARAEGTLGWMVQHQMPQTKQAVEWVGAALAGSETIVDAVGGLLASLVGMVAPFAMAAPPDGWLECNGAAISRTSYAALFARIGTTYGVGDGSTTFALPDLRGEFLRGWDNGRGVDGGRVFASGQGDAIRDIWGSFHLPTTASGYGAETVSDGAFVGRGGNGTRINGGTYLQGSGGEGANFRASRVVPTASENRPRNIAQMFCIKF